MIAQDSTTAREGSAGGSVGGVPFAGGRLNVNRYRPSEQYLFTCSECVKLIHADDRAMVPREEYQLHRRAGGQWRLTLNGKSADFEPAQLVDHREVQRRMIDKYRVLPNPIPVNDWQWAVAELAFYADQKGSIG